MISPLPALLPGPVLELGSYQAPHLGPVLRDHVDHFLVLLGRPLPNAAFALQVESIQNVVVVYPSLQHDFSSGRTPEPRPAPTLPAEGEPITPFSDNFLLRWARGDRTGGQTDDRKKERDRGSCSFRPRRFRSSSGGMGVRSL